MDLIGFLLGLVVVVVLAYVAKYLIDMFFPEPIRMPALLVVGIILLLLLVRTFLGPVVLPWPPHTK